MLGIEPRDPPALLLLAGLYRQTQRFEAASLLLREMSRLEVSDTWWLEIDAEQRRLSRQMEAEAVSEDNHQDSSESLISVA
jgi:cytochrome c-type biogenesis protein CcmH/NrfG